MPYLDKPKIKKEETQEYANPLSYSILDGVYGNGSEGYEEHRQAPKFNWDVIKRLFQGESKSMYDPRGELVKAFNLGMAVQAFVYDGKIYGMDWLPLLNTQGGIVSRLLMLAKIHQLSMEKKTQMSPFVKNLLTIAIRYLLPSLAKHLGSLEPKLRHTIVHKRVSPFVTYDREGRAFTNFVQFSEFTVLPKGFGDGLPEEINDLEQILCNEKFLDLVRLGQCPTFRWNHETSKYEVVRATEEIAKRESRHFLSDEAFAEAVENFSYICTDAMPYTYIDGKMHVAIANRKKIDGVVYPHPWLFGGRLQANETSQMGVARFVNSDIFAGTLSTQEVKSLASEANLFSHNIAYYYDPSRGGASKSTTNLTFDICLPPDFVLKIQKLKETEYDGPLYWISIDTINKAIEKQDSSQEMSEVVLETVDSNGHPICTMEGSDASSVTLKIDRDQPGVALWNKFKEFAHKSKTPQSQ